MTTYEWRRELHEGKASVLSGLLVFDETDVAGRKVGVGSQHGQDSLNAAQGGDVPQNDSCQRTRTVK